MNRHLTRIFQNANGELLTLSSLEFNQTNTLVSIYNLETPVNDIYITSIELSTSTICKNMLLPWTTKNIPDIILNKLLTKITSLMGIINNQYFLHTLEKIHGAELQDNTKIKVNITDKEATTTPQTLFTKQMNIPNEFVTIDKHAMLKTERLFLQTQTGKQITQSLKKPNRLKSDILNNIIKIAHQEIILSRQKIMKIQLG